MQPTWCSKQILKIEDRKVMSTNLKALIEKLNDNTPQGA